MKLNLGSGAKKLDGFINIDKVSSFGPDLVMDLEETPWDLPSDCAEEIVLCHVLEHLGRDVDTFLAIIKELYRVARDGCKVLIYVPHPLHLNYRTDPSHVRPVTPDTMTMFSKDVCDFWACLGAANTPFAHICSVDFELTSYEYKLDQRTVSLLLERGLLKESDAIEDFVNIYNNLVEQVDMVLTVKK